MILEIKADVAIISEPYKVGLNIAWSTDKTGKAAIWACGSYPLQEISSQKEDGYAFAKINGIHVYSCYAPPTMELSQFETMLEKIVTDATGKQPVLIAGDFNAWAEEWGSKRTNARGHTLLETFSRLDIILANVGNTSTFRKNGHHSVIDITFVSGSLMREINWHVSERYTMSDHQAILYDVGLRNKAIQNSHGLIRKGWVTKVFDKEIFLESLKDISIPRGSAEQKVNYITKQLTRACDASMPRRKSASSKRQVYWWNDRIKDRRAECLSARRTCQRGIGCPNFEELKAKYTRMRKLLRDEIRSSKRNCFKQLCDEADSNPWGNAYKVVMAKIKGRKSPQERCPEVLHKIVRTLFPQHVPRSSIQTIINESQVIPKVTLEEIEEACSKVGVNKASGPDAVPNIALKMAMSSNPAAFADIMQSCLVEGTFPKRWKRQRLVLLPKPGKPPGEPSSYRPLCMLDTIGKVLERIILNRLTPLLESEGGLSHQQFGFRKARSTLDAVNRVVTMASEAIKGKRWKGGTKQYCAVVTLDVKNAFNTANWGHILNALQRMNVPTYLLQILDSYFEDRVLEYDTEDGPREYDITAGVPQGSVLGPSLWNTLYNDILKLNLPDGAQIIGFADDIAIVVVAKHVDEIEAVANMAILMVKNWLKSVELELAEHKTELVLISSRKKKEEAAVRVGEYLVKSKNAVKYLGIMIDDTLSFKCHLDYAGKKAAKIFGALAGMLPNIGGPRSSKRLLLARVVSSVLLYGAAVWAKSLEVKDNRRKLEKSYRLSALRVCSAFKTTSADAAYVVSGMIPIDFLAEEMRRIYEAKNRNYVIGHDIHREERDLCVRSWQDRWHASENGRWTYRLIPNIRPWLDRKHGEVNYQLTQFLTGHGGYRSYLHRIGVVDSPYCPNCKGKEENPEHVLFECPRFNSERAELLTKTNRILNPDSIIQEMLESKDSWDAVCATVTTIQKELRKIEATRNEV